MATTQAITNTGQQLSPTQLQALQTQFPGLSPAQLQSMVSSGGVSGSSSGPTVTPINTGHNPISPTAGMVGGGVAGDLIGAGYNYLTGNSNNGTSINGSNPGIIGAIGAQTAENQQLLDSLSQSAVGNLTDFANQVSAQANPDLTQYINTQILAVQQGKISPATAMSAVQSKSNMLGVTVPPQFTDAVNTALTQEQQVATQGYTPVERAAIQNSLNQVINQQQGEQAAIAKSAQAQSQYGGPVRNLSKSNRHCREILTMPQLKQI